MGPMSAGQSSALRSRCSDGVAAWGISAEIAHGRCVPLVRSPGQPALSGPHYSIAAGKWSEPAEYRQRRCGPQGGPTPVAVLRYWACIELRRWFSFSVVRPLWTARAGAKKKTGGLRWMRGRPPGWDEGLPSRMGWSLIPPSRSTGCCPMLRRRCGC